MNESTIMHNNSNSTFINNNSVMNNTSILHNTNQMNPYDTSFSLIKNNTIKNAVIQKSEVSVNTTTLKLSRSVNNLKHRHLNPLYKTINIENIIDAGETVKNQHEALLDFNISNRQTGLKLNSIFIKKNHLGNDLIETCNLKN